VLSVHFCDEAKDCGDTESPVLMTVHRTARTLVFNKPYDVLPCFTDPEGRQTLGDYIDVSGVYAAGRLDRDSEGLLLLTSDGALAHRITDPEHHLPKVYLVQVERIPDAAAVERLQQGVVVGGDARSLLGFVCCWKRLRSRSGRCPFDSESMCPPHGWSSPLREGMNRQVRRMTAAVGHPTLRLVRVAIGPIFLGALLPGEWRELTKAETAEIYGYS
jgi:23S rRNA pseudouridine2457 synthase